MSDIQSEVSDIFKLSCFPWQQIFFFCTSIRMVTTLYYLNDVEEGGETAFIVADNLTLNESVRPGCN